MRVKVSRNTARSPGSSRLCSRGRLSRIVARPSAIVMMGTVDASLSYVVDAMTIQASVRRPATVAEVPRRSQRTGTRLPRSCCRSMRAFVAVSAMAWLALTLPAVAQTVNADATEAVGGPTPGSGGQGQVGSGAAGLPAAPSSTAIPSNASQSSTVTSGQTLASTGNSSSASAPAGATLTSAPTVTVSTPPSTGGGGSSSAGAASAGSAGRGATIDNIATSSTSGATAGRPTTSSSTTSSARA